MKNFCFVSALPPNTMPGIYKPKWKKESGCPVERHYTKDQKRMNKRLDKDLKKLIKEGKVRKLPNPDCTCGTCGPLYELKEKDKKTLPRPSDILISLAAGTG